MLMLGLKWETQTRLHPSWCAHLRHVPPVAECPQGTGRWARPLSTPFLIVTHNGLSFTDEETEVQSGPTTDPAPHSWPAAPEWSPPTAATPAHTDRGVLPWSSWTLPMCPLDSEKAAATNPSPRCPSVGSPGWPGSSGTFAGSMEKTS